MQKLREHPEIDYGLMLDADHKLIFDPPFDGRQFKQNLTADLCDIGVRTGAAVHYSPLLFSNHKPYFYKGVLHEYLSIEGENSRQTESGFFSDQIQDSARNRDPEKYIKDAKVLEEQLKIETDPFLISRYTFYLAQSYRDAKQFQLARVAYLSRTTLGGWREELFVSYRTAGLLGELLGVTDAEILQNYLDAYEACPTRVESLHAAARWCRVRKKYHQAYLFARSGAGVAMPAGPLFGEPWIYQFGLLDELSIAAFWTCRYQESFDVCLLLLKNKLLPASERERVRTNARYAMQALEQPELEKLLPTD